VSQITDEAFDLIDQIRPLLAGMHPVVQGAVLADLLAIFLVGHHSINPALTHQAREETLQRLIKTVWDLVPLHDDEEDET
jgi:type II secretory pathway predicted ATPase ExeA